MNWPNDADGDVLRRLDSDGFDFEKEHVIDFNIDFNSWPLSKEVVEAITKLYSNCEFIEPDEEDIENGDLIGYVQFQFFGKLTYDLVVNTQANATQQTKQFGGWCESWGLMQD